MDPLIIIVGPTAVGKTALGIALAQALDGEIISGDSVQVYRKLDIGSAKPSKEELSIIPHHLIDYLDPTEPFTAAQFQTMASKLIQKIRQRGRIPIVVGGTGLYIRALIDPFEFSERSTAQIREKWTNFLIEQGKVSLHQILSKLDPLTAERLHYNDTQRVIRALEIIDLTGKPLSEQRGHEDKIYQPLDPSIIYLGLTAPRETIYDRINQRCEEMINIGLLQETRKVLQEGYTPNLKPLQSIGYRHAIWYLTGKVTLPEMLRVFKRDTRHFAKRQLTWFRRDPRIHWYDLTNTELADIVKVVAETCGALKTRVE